jgi:hypothetical protein
MPSMLVHAAYAGRHVRQQHERKKLIESLKLLMSLLLNSSMHQQSSWLLGCCAPHLLVEGKSFNVDPTICLTFPCGEVEAEDEALSWHNIAAITTGIQQASSHELA